MSDSDATGNGPPPQNRPEPPQVGPSAGGPSDPPKDDPAHRALHELDRRVKDALDEQEARVKADEALYAKAESTRASGAAWRIIIDLVAATALLGALGYGLDVVSNGSPWGLLTGLIAGFVLGMWLAARRAAAIQRGGGA